MFLGFDFTSFIMCYLPKLSAQKKPLNWTVV